MIVKCTLNDHFKRDIVQCVGIANCEVDVVSIEESVTQGLLIRFSVEFETPVQKQMFANKMSEDSFAAVLARGKVEGGAVF